ncbi:hypothetical protein VP01_2854g6 [Puccinia sorghi]|uniref:GAG-pre-integrase domain-containing protein n=1 Tax=Puccinia sorghi TaxID=27349 RepID=A0A0L6V220_9BASI|nr:hypothetical protein VP01_2854g6 [Puccinia sorghi]
MANNEGGLSKANIPKLEKTNFLHCPSVMLTKLQEIVHLKESQKSKSTGVSKISEKTSEDQTDSAAALKHESKKGKKKGKHGPYCEPGKHNPEATSHDSDHCWKLHPEQRLNSGSKSFSNGTHHPTTQLDEANNGHGSELSLLLTEAASKPIGLNSGATHHLITCLEIFQPISKSNIKIVTGGHSNFLNPTAVGVATLANPLEKLVIIKTADRGATIIIDNTVKLLGSTKNNLLELHSSHFELIKPSSSFYQSSPDSPKWHARLGHPNPKYQSVMSRKTLEAVHMDLVRLFPVKPSAGFAYFLMLINQFSCYQTIKFLKSKSETFFKFLDFKKSSEKETGNSICMRISNRGGGSL